MASRLPVLAAVSSLAASATILSAAALNLALSFQISDLARLGMPLSVPSPNAENGRVDITATMCALSFATLASNGARPCTMAPMRATWLPITVNALWRYLMASSGFWNCAAAGRAVSTPQAAARIISFFMRGSDQQGSGAGQPGSGRTTAGRRESKDRTVQAH